jgi:hypothetical protein
MIIPTALICTSPVDPVNEQCLLTCDSIYGSQKYTKV